MIIPGNVPNVALRQTTHQIQIQTLGQTLTRIPRRLRRIQNQNQDQDHMARIRRPRALGNATTSGVSHIAVAGPFHRRPAAAAEGAQVGAIEVHPLLLVAYMVGEPVPSVLYCMVYSEL